MNIRIFPPDGIPEASVDLPLSKSMSARALVINKIGGFTPDIELSDSDDTKILAAALTNPSPEVFVGESGTALRFLTAYYAASEGSEVVLTCSERMKERPVSQLVEALRKMGGDIEYVENEGKAPLKIRGKKLSGGSVEIDASESSQFISALMMIAPMLSNPLEIKYEGELNSMPYIKMTAAMMKECGVEPEFLYKCIKVPNEIFVTAVTKIERDWSAASYWYEITALSAGWTTLNDMDEKSIQGDSKIQDFGEKIGVVTSESEDVEGALELAASPEQHSRLDADMEDYPDLVPTLAVTSAALAMPFRFTGVKNLRLKESDRLEALKAEALKLGLIFETEGDNVLTWEGKRVSIQEMPQINPHNDHRIAMAFAPLAIFVPGIVIEDCETVSKSYPAFWTHLEEAGFVLERF